MVVIAYDKYCTSSNEYQNQMESKLFELVAGNEFHRVHISYLLSMTENSTNKKKDHTPYEGRVSPPIANFLGGILGGAVSTTVFQPLDLIKTRFQVQTDRTKKTHSAGSTASLPQHVARQGQFSYGGTLSAFRTIVKTEGVFALYQGLLPNVIGASVSWGLYILVYGEAKKVLEAKYGTLGPGFHLIAAAEAGVITAILTNPIWVVKTRMQLQMKNQSGNYTGLKDAFSTILKEEGFAGLYKGLIPGLLSVSHGAFQFMAYEELKRLMIQHNGGKSDGLGSVHFLVAGSVSKIFATVLTYPAQVVKSRLQERPLHNVAKYTGVIDVIKKIWVYEGPRGFYNGLVPNLLKVTPTSALTLSVCELVVRVLTKPAG